MKDRYQVLESGQKRGRPTLVVQPPAVRLLTIDVPAGLSQRQWKQVKKQRLAHELGQEQHYRNYALSQQDLPDGKRRYELMVLDQVELMRAWRSCYQRAGRWPRVILGAQLLQSAGDDNRLSRECLLRYWGQKALWLVWGALLCLPLVVLALWHQQLANQFSDLQVQWQQVTRHQPLPMTSTQPVLASEVRNMLYPQLLLLDHVFGSHVRLKSLDWKAPVLTVQAEADSALHFSQTWDQWQRSDPSIKHELDDYGYKKRLFFKAKVFTPHIDPAA